MKQWKEIIETPDPIKKGLSAWAVLLLCLQCLYDALSAPVSVSVRCLDGLPMIDLNVLKRHL